jgi:5-formyltetrahydrofolate cyclo-ligase
MRRPRCLLIDMSSGTELEAEKRIMRQIARAKRSAIAPAARRKAALDLAGRGLGFSGASTGVAAGYYPFRDEFDCLPLLQRLANEGWRLALPIARMDAPLTFHEWSFASPLVKGPFGVAEPSGGEALIPDIVIVPLLAFDRRCFRLGYGGGHYDRTLADLRALRPIIAIGLAFETQEVDEVPICAYDQRLDWIATPKEALAPAEGG